MTRIQKIFLFTLACLLLAEGGQRVVNVIIGRNELPNISKQVIDLPQGYRTFAPYASGWHISFDGLGSLQIKLNSLGIRGPEFNPKGERPIVFIGDSIVFNGGVPDESTFVELLRAQYEKEMARTTQFMNFGMSDTGIVEYYARLKHIIAPLHPKLIVLGLYLNDSRPAQGFMGEKQHEPISYLILYSPLRYSALMRTLAKAIEIQRINSDPKILDRFRWVPRYRARSFLNSETEWDLLVSEARFDWGALWYDEELKTIENNLRLIVELTRKIDSKLLVVIFPVAPQTEIPTYYKSWHYPQEKLKVLIENLDIPVFDILPYFREHSSDGLFADQCHLTSIGNRVAAEALYPVLRDTLGH